MKTYILSVICSAIICGILTGLLEKKGTTGKILKLICGVFLTFTVIGPVADIKLDDLSNITSEWVCKGNAISAMGADYTADAMAAIIKQEVQAYILDKAAELDADIHAEVFLDASFVPSSVILEGSISAGSQIELEQIISQDLGIPKEEQRWNIS